MASVLVVDDDSDSRGIFATALGKAGHTVAAAPNGRDAMTELISRTYDAVIVDLMMPEMGGLELMRIIRSYLRWSTIPFIVVTAYPDAISDDDLRNLAVRKVFLKADFLLTDLIASVESCDQARELS